MRISCRRTYSQNIHFSYYFNGNDSTISDYLNPKIMDGLLHEINNMIMYNHTPFWLSETGTDWCSCAKKTETYLDGFLWLDKLGLCATHGCDKVLRQDIVAASFGLLNDDVTPRPDYWLSFLYNKLMGRYVYNVSIDEGDANLRLYAGSSKK